MCFVVRAQLQQHVEAGRPAIPEMGASLQQLSSLLQRELSSLSSSGAAASADVMDGSKPHLKVGCRGCGGEGALAGHAGGKGGG